MPISRYGVLRGAVVDTYRERQSERPHYQLHVRADTTDFRVAVNVQYQRPPSELLYLVDDDFRHPMVGMLPSLKAGFSRVQPRRGGLAIDYVRGGLLRRRDMRPLPANTSLWCEMPKKSDVACQLLHFAPLFCGKSGSFVLAPCVRLRLLPSPAAPPESPLSLPDSPSRSPSPPSVPSPLRHDPGSAPAQSLV